MPSPRRRLVMKTFLLWPLRTLGERGPGTCETKKALSERINAAPWTRRHVRAGALAHWRISYNRAYHRSVRQLPCALIMRVSKQKSLLSSNCASLPFHVPATYILGARLEASPLGKLRPPQLWRHPPSASLQKSHPFPKHVYSPNHLQSHLELSFIWRKVYLANPR